MNLKQSIARKCIRWGYHSQPSFIIIGAQKAGTTALFDILSQHPQMVPPKDKELHFFDNARIPYPKFEKYHQKFPLPHELKKGQITFEASPSYLFNKNCPERLFDYNKSIKLIVVLRDPVERAYSAWTMFHNFKDHKQARFRDVADYRSFEEAIQEELFSITSNAALVDNKAYIQRGIYVEQIERYFSLFDRSQIYITEQEALKNNFDLVMKDICEFTEIEHSFVFKPTNSNVGKYKYDDKIQKILEELGVFYRPHNKKLFSLLGKEYNW